MTSVRCSGKETQFILWLWILLRYFHSKEANNASLGFVGKLLRHRGPLCSESWIRVWAKKTNKKSTRRRDIAGVCLKHFNFAGNVGLTEESKNAKLTIPTPEAIKQLQFMGKNLENTQPQRDMAKRSKISQMPSCTGPAKTYYSAFSWKDDSCGIVLYMPRWGDKFCKFSWRCSISLRRPIVRMWKPPRDSVHLIIWSSNVETSCSNNKPR